jgi:hypothetical protein
LAGPPLICAIGEVGVLGDDFEVTGDRGEGFDFEVGAVFVTICLVGGAFTGCADFVVCRVVAGGGPGLPPLVCIFSTIAADFVSSLGLEGVLENFSCTWLDARALFRFFTSDLSFAGVLSANADPFKIVPSPPFVDPLCDCSSIVGPSNEDIFLEAARLSGNQTAVVEFSLFSSRLLTSLGLRRPSMGALPFSPGRSTATKLALTLLTGLLPLEIYEGFGDRPRLGGDVD